MPNPDNQSKTAREVFSEPRRPSRVRGASSFALGAAVGPGHASGRPGAFYPYNPKGGPAWAGNPDYPGRGSGPTDYTTRPGRYKTKRPRRSGAVRNGSVPLVLTGPGGREHR